MSISSISISKVSKQAMKSKIPTSKQITDAIVQVCFDVVEFSRLYDQDHPKSGKSVFQCNEDIKKGLEWFINAETPTEMRSNINDYLQSVATALELYKNLSVPIESKDKIIVQLSKLQTHLTNLKKEISIH